MSKMLSFLVALSFVLSSCNSAAPPTLNGGRSTYPGPAYPGPSQSESTAVPTVPVRDARPFQIDRPVKAGDTTVKGSGPSGVPIVIENVTTMGDKLGKTTIGPDNRFVATVPPLHSNERIGLSIGDLSGTDYVWDQFQADVFKGPGAMSVPLVGYFQDTVPVQP